MPTAPKTERPSLSPRPVRRKRRRSPALQMLKILGCICLGGLGLFAGYMYGHPHSLRGLQAMVSMAPAVIRGESESPADAFPNQNAINLMVIGRDYDYTDRDQIMRTHARSDMLMVAHVDFANGKISMISIPRDTRAVIPGWGVSKINSAHAHGGPGLTKETVLQNFGIPTDKYVALDFEGFEQAIDELGGVDLVVDKKMDYDDNWGHLHIHLKPGLQHLNGQQAMGFVRFRHSDSDLVRTQRQQTLIAALKEKLHNPSSLAKLPAVLNAINSHMDSDLTTEQKVVIANFARSLTRDNLKMETVPSLDGSGTFVLTDWKKAAPMIESIFGVTPPLSDSSDSPSVSRRRYRRHRHQTVLRSQ